MRIGFIGLGNMGQGMARNLHAYCKAQGFEFSVHDINKDAMQPFIQKGANPRKSITTIAKNSDIIFTSLPSSKQVNEIALSPEGLLESLPQNAVWFETSTSDLSKWQKVRDAAPKHLTLIDAPVTGGTEGAAAGTLTMLLGAEEQHLVPHLPLLKSFTKKQVIMGSSGAGYIAKLSQLHLNYLVAQGIGEALMMGAKGGLNLTVLSDVLSHSCAQSYVVDNYIPKVLGGSYDESFALGLARKDMRLVKQLGDHLEIEMPLASEVLASYEDAVSEYGQKAPHLSIVKLIENNTGKSLRT